MKTFDQIQNKMDLWAESINVYLSRLTLRERILVVFTTILIFVAVIGTSLWKMHAVAEAQQSRLNELKDNLLWMQSNVVRMKPADDLNLSSLDKIQRVSQQQGLTVASQDMDGNIQVVATHQNYSILANFLTQLVQMGLSIEKLELTKVGEQIKLTATVR